jgi:2'-hydroxyisoflavone reductase
VKLLVIGGTRFLGRHLVQAAVESGHHVTLFNRGQSATSVPAGVEHRVGDRRAGLDSLSPGTWDAVIDTCGYLPGEVAAMADCLHGRVGSYAFISSISVFADFSQPNGEDAAVGRIDDPETTVVDGRTYGPLKALCEEALQSRLGDRALVVRPGLIVGPHDPTGRFTWWPARLARAAPGERLLAPGAPEDAVQFIDARDLAAFILRLVEGGRFGLFNATSPQGLWTMGDVLRACAEVAGTQPSWDWAPSAWLLEQGVGPWMELPLWLPAEGEHAAFMRVETTRAEQAGLKQRPIADTAADTLAWWQALPPEARAFPQTGLAPEREAALLARLAAGVRL